MQLRLLATAPAWESPLLWQSVSWAAFQTSIGREVRWYEGTASNGAAVRALVVIDRTIGGFSTWDLPRGPLLSDEAATADAEEFLRLVGAEAKADRALSLFWSGTDPRLAGVQLGTTSRRHEQPEATVILDLTFTDDTLLTQMHQKGRYNIRLAEKHGVTVEQSRDIGSYAKLAAATSARDGFRAPSPRHFERFLQNIPGSFLLLAFAPGVDGPVAGLIGVVHDKHGIYYYGASSDSHRPLMAPYLLQWEAIKLCGRLGATSYDLLGIAPPEAGPDHPWHGITTFKTKFGGTVITYPTEREYKIRPLIAAGLRMKRRIVG